MADLWGPPAEDLAAEDEEARAFSFNQLWVGPLMAAARAPIWSREGLKQRCGATDASALRVGKDEGKYSLSEYLDYLRNSELKGVRHASYN